MPDVKGLASGRVQLEPRPPATKSTASQTSLCLTQALSSVSLQLPPLVERRTWPKSFSNLCSPTVGKRLEKSTLHRQLMVDFKNQGFLPRAPPPPPEQFGGGWARR